MKTFTARYPGRCATDCGDRIAEGDDVTYVDDQLMHAECVDRDRPVCGMGPMPEPRAVTVCKHCHLVQPCDCD